MSDTLSRMLKWRTARKINMKVKRRVRPLRILNCSVNSSICLIKRHIHPFYPGAEMSKMKLALNVSKWFSTLCLCKHRHSTSRPLPWLCVITGTWSLEPTPFCVKRQARDPHSLFYHLSNCIAILRASFCCV